MKQIYKYIWSNSLRKSSETGDGMKLEINPKMKTENFTNMS